MEFLRISEAQTDGSKTIPRFRIALYSPGMVGLGHIRRNLLLANAFARMPCRPVVLLIAEAREAGAFVTPPGVDCLTLPALRKDVDGRSSARYLDISLDDLVSMRSKIIRAAVESFSPDLFIADHLARGAFSELDSALAYLQSLGRVRRILGLRDILGDPNTVKTEWEKAATCDVIRDSYDSVWIYGDCSIHDVAKEYHLPADIAAKLQYTGYLDRRKRLAKAKQENHDPYELLGLPPGRLALCLVGGGQDGARLAEAFARAMLPAETNGIIVTGPFMSDKVQMRILDLAAKNPRMRVLHFVPEPTLLLDRADYVIAMGGYNTVSEILSFEKKALIVPRVQRAPEQLIRARRMQDLGLLDFLNPEHLDSDALTSWLESNGGSPQTIRRRIDFEGLTKIPQLFKDLMFPIDSSRENPN